MRALQRYSFQIPQMRPNATIKLPSQTKTLSPSSVRLPLSNPGSSLSLASSRSPWSTASARLSTGPSSLSSTTVPPASQPTTTRQVSAFRKLWDNSWITEEADAIVRKSYRVHRALGDRSTDTPLHPTKQELETLGVSFTYSPKNFGDRLAYGMVNVLKPFTHMFFRDKYNHHAVVLETVAAVPGIVGGMYRHLRSLRHMSRDHGWINPLWEESENERMHLLTWMQVTQPTPIEKVLVMSAQGVYFTFYSLLYAIAPRVAHRFAGYLEEEAVSAYTAYLKAIDSGALANEAAPLIAKKYWRLPDDATIRDVVLYIRADECMHRNANHHFADLIEKGKRDCPPQYPEYHQSD